MRILVPLCLATCSLYGQAGQLAAPSTGFVFDQSTHALRQIQGIPGAALVGTPVDFGLAVTAAWVAPHLDSAFVLAADGQAHLFRLSANAPAAVAVDSLGAPQSVVFSPSGTAAALYSPGSVQVIKGLPDAPAATAPIRLRPNPRSRRQLPETLAISDDGAYLLYSSGGPIELIGVAGNNRQVMESGTGAVAAFAPGNHDAAIVNSTKLTLYQDIAGAATERSFAGIAAPSAMAYSPDSQKLLVASATGRAVTTIQVASGDISTLTCDCTPATLIPMGTVFRLNELGSGPLWLLDPSSDRGLVFVPVPSTN
jgi:DNA-binding beta-propeller fold protein YncE